MKEDPVLYCNEIMISREKGRFRIMPVQMDNCRGMLGSRNVFCIFDVAKIGGELGDVVQVTGFSR